MRIAIVCAVLFVGGMTVPGAAVAQHCPTRAALYVLDADATLLHAYAM